MINNSKLWQKDGFMPDMMSAVASPQQQSSFNPMALSANEPAAPQEPAYTAGPAQQAQQAQQTQQAQQPQQNPNQGRIDDLTRSMQMLQQQLMQMGASTGYKAEQKRRVLQSQIQEKMFQIQQLQRGGL